MVAAGATAQGGFYPFFPPEQMTMGQILLNAAIYGYVLSEASNMISDGSELLLLVPRIAPVVGSIVLPVLGAVPDGMMVMFSGLGDNAQQQVTVGVGALAGSTVMLLTLPWFIAVFTGRVNIKDGECTYRAPKDLDGDFEKITPGLSLAASLRTTGVGISDELHQNAKIMLYSIVGYFIVQVPALFVDRRKPIDISTDELHAEQVAEAGFERWFSLLGLIVCTIGFVWYLQTQWHGAGKEGGHVEEKITSLHVKAMQKGTLTLQGAIAQFREDAGLGAELESGGAVRADGDEATQQKVRRMCQILAPFFAVYDLNGDNSIDFDEFRMLFKDIRGNVSRSTLHNIFNAADLSQSGSMSFEEFAACIMSFAFYPNGTLQDNKDENEAGKSTSTAGTRRSVPKVDLDRMNFGSEGDDADEAEDQDKEEGDDDDDDDEEEDMPEDFVDLDPDEQQRRILARSCTKMGIGTILILLFSDPMVDVMNEMGIRLHINPFYVAFLLAPMASNASEMVSAYNYAKRRTQKSINTSLSTLEGAAVMNNTFVLGVFYALIFVKGLAWEFTAETISIILIQLLIGGMVLSRRSMTLLEGLIVLSFYALAMAVVAILERLGVD